MAPATYVNTSGSKSVNLNALTTETSIAQDDFVAMVKRVAEMFPESVWGDQMFFKHDMSKAFRQVPGSKQSRKWGAFAVKNPATGFIELFQHLSLWTGQK